MLRDHGGGGARARRSAGALGLWAVLFGLASLPACAESGASPHTAAESSGRASGDEAEPGGDESPRPRDRDTDLLEALQAIGYVDWDPDADPESRGVVLHDANADPGYNLYSNDADRVFLMNLRGRLVHEWSFPEAAGLPFADLLSDGRLVLGLGTDLALAEFDGTVRWRLPLNVHHDVAETADGSFLVLTRETHEYHGRDVIFDGITRVSGEGEVLSRWSSFEHLSELRRHHPPRVLDMPARQNAVKKKMRYDYYHTNCIEVLPATPLGERDARFRAGNLLLCLRNANCILVLDQDDYSVQWSWGVGELQGPHMPTFLEDGNLLLFDNGARRGSSRVLELGLPSDDVVWRYQGSPPESFHSKFRGSNQRLPNGNTLICESERGHAFEVTSDGEMVWEFWNPDIVDGQRRRIYRLVRYTPEFVEPLLFD